MGNKESMKRDMARYHFVKMRIVCNHVWWKDDNDGVCGISNLSVPPHQ